MKRGAWYWRLVVLSAIMWTLTLGTTSPGVAGEAITIDYWHINSESFGGNAVKEIIKRFEAANPGIKVAVKEIIKRFEAANPGIKVAEKYQPAGYTGLIQQAQVAMAGKRPPAVVQMSYNLLAYMAGPILPVNGYFA